MKWADNKLDQMLAEISKQETEFEAVARKLEALKPALAAAVRANTPKEPKTVKVNTHPKFVFRTYTIGRTGGEQFIDCKRCRFRSFNPWDISQRYCSMCKSFHERAHEKL